MIIHTGPPLPEPRLRTRRMDMPGWVWRESYLAQQAGQWRFQGTCNGFRQTFKRRVQTEAWVIVTDPAGITVVWQSRIRAKWLDLHAIYQQSPLGMTSAGILRTGYALHREAVHAWWAARTGEPATQVGAAPVPERSPERGNRRKIELL